jgi:hypothetical protein
MDRIESIYDAIEQMANVHGKPRPKEFGGGKWNFNTEIRIWKNQIIGHEEEQGYRPLSSHQWKIINQYIKIRRKELGLSREKAKLKRVI